MTDLPEPHTLQVGEQAPDFTLPDEQGNNVHLYDVLAQGNRVIVYFYPQAMTPGCTREACDFSSNVNKFTETGYTVFGISRDSIDKLARFKQAEHLQFSLLSDPDTTVHRQWGAWGEKKLYGRIHEGVLRSTVVLDTDGTVLLARYNVRARGHVDMLMRLISELQ